MSKTAVVIPNYNGIKFLPDCLNSLKQQSAKDFDVIVVDDCSTDDSLAILRAYEKKYPEKFIVIASPENRKQGGAKNLGLTKAQGDFIGFIDSDDWVTPDYYEKLIARAEETGADITLIYKRSEVFREKKQCAALFFDECGKLLDLYLNPELEGTQNIYLDIASDWCSRWFVDGERCGTYDDILWNESYLS